jgi:hypothetical protein
VAHADTVVNIVLSDDDDDEAASLLDQTDPTGQVEPSMGCVSTDDDAEVTGKTSVETVNLEPIMDGARGATMHPATDWVQTASPSGV